MSSRAGSGHPTSSLSATDLMVNLYFGGTLRYDLAKPAHPNNDRVIFSKGHASPLFYALYAAAGELTQRQLDGYRQLGSPLEGHPRPNFKHAEAATGSLGQGLSIGVGFALNAKYLDKLPYRTYVLVGDSEFAEGSNWEAIEIAAKYKLGNLIGILDVNRLGQRGETMYGRHVEVYQRRLRAFGWRTVVCDGHDHTAISRALAQAAKTSDRPLMIIARTRKGKGVRFWENQPGWHGKPLPAEELERALADLAPVDLQLVGRIAKPAAKRPAAVSARAGRLPEYAIGEAVSTRQAFGQALAALGRRVVVLDAEVSNSTYTEYFADRHPERYFEMYIAEQNMAGTSLGLSRRGKRVFASTFAAFWTRAHDQVRMSAYSGGNVVYVGSHAGVSIGPDGPSQMGLEDIALFRGVGAAVLYPADGTSAAKLTAELAQRDGLSYLRTTRGDTPVLYKKSERFRVGGSKTLRRSSRDRATVVAAGITVHEALRAADQLARRGIKVRVIDAYSIQPLDTATLRQAARETNAIITVEDHHVAGGLGEAVRSALAGERTAVHSLAVTKTAGSATPAEQLAFQGCDAAAIMKAVEKHT